MSLTKLALLSLLLTPITTLHAQNDNGELGFPGASSQPSTTVPTIQVYSRETILDVLVTDDKGQPVRGLTRSDFTVEEDGKPQPIRSFSEYDKTTPPPPPRTLPPNTFTNSTALPANGPVQIFLFDLLGTPPAVMQGAKKYIADYLRTMPAGTQVALFEFSPSKDLRLLQGFTSDGPAAAKAVDNLDVEWIHNPVYGCPIAVAGFNQIAAYVAGIRGRKNLIWVIPTIPQCVMISRDGGYAQTTTGITSPDPPDMTVAHRLKDLYDLFTREQVAIYPFDPRGVHTFGANPVQMAAALRTEQVADETGGATSNSNDYKASITTIVDRTLYGYTLSFVPTRPDQDGHFHPIKITVDRPGVHLSYRPGYNDEQPHPPDPALIHDMTQGPMRLGAMPATQILFDLSVAPAPPALQPTSATKTPHTKGTPYAATFTIDPTQLALLQQPDGTRTTSLELDLGAFDFYGNLVSARSQQFKITVAPAQYDAFFKKPLHLTLATDLPSGKLTLRGGVFDTAASKAGTLETPYTVPKK